MSKKSVQFTCSSCGETHAKWLGRCSNCKSYNTLVEGQVPTPAPSRVSIMGFESRTTSRTSARLTPTGLSTRSAPPPRVTTGHPEFDRVLGGGLVEASALLVGGAPGIGKSTLLLQISANLSAGVRSYIFPVRNLSIKSRFERVD